MHHSISYNVKPGIWKEKEEKNVYFNGFTKEFLFLFSFIISATSLIHFRISAVKIFANMNGTTSLSALCVCELLYCLYYYLLCKIELAKTQACERAMGQRENLSERTIYLYVSCILLSLISNPLPILWYMRCEHEMIAIHITVNWLNFQNYFERPLCSMFNIWWTWTLCSWLSSVNVTFD